MVLFIFMGKLMIKGRRRKMMRVHVRDSWETFEGRKWAFEGGGMVFACFFDFEFRKFSIISFHFFHLQILHMHLHDHIIRG